MNTCNRSNDIKTGSPLNLILGFTAVLIASFSPLGASAQSAVSVVPLGMNPLGEPGSGPQTGAFVFNRTGPTTAALTVTFTVSGSATQGDDYASLGTTVTFSAGSSFATLGVFVNDDAFLEPTEVVAVTVMAGSGYSVGFPSVAAIPILDDEPATVAVVAFTDATAGEPGTGQGAGTFTFTRLGLLANPVLVNFTVGGTATSGIDYTPIGTTVGFAGGVAPGSASATVNVTVIDDALLEGDETVVVTLISGTGYVVGSPSSATVTIKDDEAVVTVAATDATAGEPLTGQGSGTFTFTRTGFTAGALMVSFTVAGTATTGLDYDAIGTTVTFLAGSTTATKTVSVIDDPGAALVELDETVIVTLAAGVGYEVGGSSMATVTIKDDDAVVTVVATDPVAAEQAVGQNDGVFTFTRTGFTGSALAVNYVPGGTAGVGDYIGLPGIVNFVAGAAVATATVTVIDDVQVEPLETVTVTLLPGLSYTVGMPGMDSITILDDDVAPLPEVIVAVAATDATAGEPGSGEGTGTFTFTRTGALDLPLIVTYLVSGTATSGSDYTLGTTVSFFAGSATAIKTVTVVDDVLVEGAETVVVTLTAGVDYSVGVPVEATITIEDDDTTHSADTDQNFRISLLELTRVIELYNTRNGTTRTGCYKIDATGEDGFAPDPTRAPGAIVALPFYHSADSNQDAKLSLLELTRVIELYNYRSGTTRTGQYHVQPGTEDGFAPGP